MQVQREPVDRLSGQLRVLGLGRQPGNVRFRKRELGGRRPAWHRGGGGTGTGLGWRRGGRRRLCSRRGRCLRDRRGSSTGGARGGLLSRLSSRSEAAASQDRCDDCRSEQTAHICALIRVSPPDPTATGSDVPSRGLLQGWGRRMSSALRARLPRLARGRVTEDRPQSSRSREALAPFKGLGRAAGWGRHPGRGDPGHRSMHDAASARGAPGSRDRRRMACIHGGR